MAVILVAEDSPTQAVSIQLMLEDAGYDVRIAADGDQAMQQIMDSPPDILLTDMHMPGKTGLELTEAIRESHPQIPVILITADGSEELAAAALKKGAASYIPKKNLENELIDTLGGIVSMLETRQTESNVAEALVYTESTFVFGNDQSFATTLVGHFETILRNARYTDETELFRIVLALKEAFINAIEHGNLELDSEIRDEDGGTRFHEIGEERKKQDPYRDRTVKTSIRITEDQLVFTVTDQGTGFDPSRLPDPEDPENLLKAHGRGLLLIRSFMDEVSFNETGNQITMVKHRKRADVKTG